MRHSVFRIVSDPETCNLLRSWWIFFSCMSRCQCWGRPSLGGCVPHLYGHLQTRCANSTAWLRQQLPRIGTVCLVGNLSQCQMWNGHGCTWWMVVWNFEPSSHSLPGANTHTSMGHPTMHATVEELNSGDVQTYMRVCQQVRAWKKEKGNYKQPWCPTMLELIDKMPSAPKSRKKDANCHCHQLKVEGKP